MAKPASFTFPEQHFLSIILWLNFNILICFVAGSVAAAVRELAVRGKFPILCKAFGTLHINCAPGRGTSHGLVLVLVCLSLIDVFVKSLN